MIGGLLYTIGGLIEIVIGLRFLFRLLGANPSSPFVELIYRWSTPFVAPFAGIFGTNATVTGNGAVTTSVLDWSALVALLVIGAIVGVIGAALNRRRGVAL